MVSGDIVSRSGGRCQFAYHRLVRESLDLLDGAGSSLLEGNTVHLFTKEIYQHIVHSSPVIVNRFSSSASVWKEKRTLLWRWMVYSRATTSEMAERPCLPVFLVVDDISAN